MFQKANMEYKKLGNTGLEVSVLSYGMYNTCEVIPFEEHVKIIKTCLQNGINLFDVAELYSEGKDEERLGKILKEIKEPRERLIITTKFWDSPDKGINSTGGTNRKHIKESVKSSLERLQLDYVDIVFAHSFDEKTPIEEIVRGFHQVIEEGYSFYWGTSNWDADRIYAAIEICEKYNLHKPVVAENQYNMVNRQEMEEEYRTLFEKHRYGLLAYSPLLGGFLTGKYLDEKSEGRLSSDTGVASKEASQFRWLHRVDFEKTNNSLREIKVIAEKELNCDLTALAIAWVAKYQHTSTALFGARNMDQLTDCLKAIDVYKKLTPEIEGKINKIMGTNPPARTDFRKNVPEPHIRPLAE